MAKIDFNVEITLFNQNDKITMNADKCVLRIIQYFQNLFNFGIEKNQTKMNIKVDNAKIAHDVILSLYGQEINIGFTTGKIFWKFSNVEIFFVCIMNVSLLYDLKVPEEGFDLLLQVIEQFDYTNDQKLMQTIKKNIPEKYDLNNFSIDFIKELLKYNHHKIVSCSDSNIIIWDEITGKMLYQLNGHTDCRKLVLLFLETTQKLFQEVRIIVSSYGMQTQVKLLNQLNDQIRQVM